MTINIGINGLGRIGRLVFRIVEQRRLAGEDIKVVGMNDLTNVEYIIHMIKHDSVHGTFDFDIEYDNDYIFINNNKIKRFMERDPSKIDWKSIDTDIVIESTGFFTTLEQASMHLIGGAKKVIITAPSKDAPMFVMGVNHEDYNNENVISNASCTTNCLAPLVKLLHDNFGIEEGLMTTIHSSTSSQKIVDGPSVKNWRLGRSAINNIIPTSTGAASAVGKIIPVLNGKINGMSFRVPTINISVIDFNVRLKENVEYEDIVNCVKEYSRCEMNNILGYTEDELVSSDFIGDPRSCIFDIKSGMSIGNNFFKLIAWYDNEWGYSNRVVDLIKFIY